MHPIVTYQKQCFSRRMPLSSLTEYVLLLPGGSHDVFSTWLLYILRARPKTQLFPPMRNTEIGPLITHDLSDNLGFGPLGSR